MRQRHPIMVLACATPLAAGFFATAYGVTGGVAVVAVTMGVLLLLPGLPTPAGGWWLRRSRLPAGPDWTSATDFGVTARVLAAFVLAAAAHGWRPLAGATTIAAACLISRSLDRRHDAAAVDFVAEDVVPCIQLAPSTAPALLTEDMEGFAYGTVERDGEHRIVHLEDATSDTGPSMRTWWDIAVVPARIMDGSVRKTDCRPPGHGDPPVLVRVGDLIVGALDSKPRTGRSGSLRGGADRR